MSSSRRNGVELGVESGMMNQQSAHQRQFCAGDDFSLLRSFGARSDTNSQGVDGREPRWRSTTLGLSVFPYSPNVA